MGREYVVQSWVKHDEDDWRNIPDHLLDDSAGYSGEQIGNRQAKSNGNTLIRSSVSGYLPNGKADIAGAADPADDKTGNPLLLVDPAYKILLEYPGKVAALEKAFNEGKLAQSLFKQALKILDAKQEKAQRKIDALAASLAEHDEEPEEEATPPPPLEEEAIQVYKPTEEEEKQALENFNNSIV